MSTVFSKIVTGEIPCYKIAENENFLAFLDVNPLVAGHTLVIPKIEQDYIFDLDDQVLESLIVFSKEVAVKLKKAIPCKRIGVSIIGLEVPHVHIHLIPINSIQDMNFSKEKTSFGPAELIDLQNQILSVV
jgi:histidine triad (HIT) family protein